MNQFLISSADITGTLLSLQGTEARHAIQVLRLRKGDIFLATDGRGLQVRAEVTDVRQDTLLAEVRERTDELEPSSKITVALGLLKKRDRLEFAVEKLTELGAQRIVLFQGDHSERSHARPDRLEGIVQSALKQSLGSWLPELCVVDSLEEVFDISGIADLDEIYLADETIASQSTQKPVEKSLEDSILTPQQRPQRLLLIGPEGGFSKREREWLDANHPECRAVSLGKRRLRAETAAIAGLLFLQLRS